MKIIIDHQCIRREILGPFSVIATRSDMERMRDALTAYLDRPDWSYGTAEVHPRVETKTGSPLPWDQGTSL